MVKQQRRFGVPHELRNLASELAVGNSDSSKVEIRSYADIHCTPPAELVSRKIHDHCGIVVAPMRDGQ
jgi:hypothetical protein